MLQLQLPVFWKKWHYHRQYCCHSSKNITLAVSCRKDFKNSLGMKIRLCKLVGNPGKWLPHPIYFCSFYWCLLSVLFPLLILTWKEASSYATTLFTNQMASPYLNINRMRVNWNGYTISTYQKIQKWWHASSLLQFRKVMSREKKILTSTIHFDVIYESDRDLSERVIQSDSLNLFRTCYASIMQHQ